MNLTPYLLFDGSCEAALSFYAEAFGGSYGTPMRFADGPASVPPEHASRILHAAFVADGLEFMASDCPPGAPAASGSRVALAVRLPSVETQDRVWERLSRDAKIEMPLQPMFWGDRFGSLTDRFGIDWMLLCALPDGR